jgi:hypothetical protein
MLTKSAIELKRSENQTRETSTRFDNLHQNPFQDEACVIYIPAERWEKMDSPDWLTVTYEPGKKIDEEMQARSLE